MNVSFVAQKNIKYNSNKNKGRIISKIWDVKKKGGGVVFLVFTPSPPLPPHSQKKKDNTRALIDDFGFWIFKLQMEI